jgi:hypothetical protein
MTTGTARVLAGQVVGIVTIVTTLLLALAALLFHVDLSVLQVSITLTGACLLCGVAPPVAAFALLCAGRRRPSACAAFLGAFSCVALFLFVPVALFTSNFAFSPLPGAITFALPLVIGSPLLHAAGVLLRISAGVRIAGGGQHQVPRLRGDTMPPAALGQGPDPV